MSRWEDGGCCPEVRSVVAAETRAGPGHCTRTCEDLGDDRRADFLPGRKGGPASFSIGGEKGFSLSGSFTHTPALPVWCLWHWYLCHITRVSCCVLHFSPSNGYTDEEESKSQPHNARCAQIQRRSETWMRAFQNDISSSEPIANTKSYRPTGLAKSCVNNKNLTSKLHFVNDSKWHFRMNFRVKVS